MLKLALVVAALISSSSSALYAQAPVAPVASPRISLGEVSPTPEMWLYEQERIRYENPQTMVREKAELRGAQRQGRIASMKWYGYSNSRPTANTTPMTGVYSPSWYSANSIPCGVPVIVADDGGRSSRSSSSRY